MSERNFLECHPERRGRRGDRGVEGTLCPPSNFGLVAVSRVQTWFLADV